MKIAVFTKNRTNPAYTGARLGADRAAHRLGAETMHFVPETPDDAAQQSALVDQALKWAPDAVVMSPVHPTRVDAAIGRIHAAGIPIVGMVSPVTAVPCVSFVHSDDYRLGLAIAGHLFDRLGGHGQILVMSGHVDSPTSIERLRGFADAVAQYPDISVAGTVAGDYLRPTAHARATEWIARHGGTWLDGCLVANDIMALGVIDALEQARRKALIVGVNAIPEAIPAIKHGVLLATADFNAMRMAYLAAECAVRHLNGESVPGRIVLPVQVVDASNCHLWDLPYQDRSVLTLADLPRDAQVRIVGPASPLP